MNHLNINILKNTFETYCRISCAPICNLKVQVNIFKYSENNTEPPLIVYYFYFQWNECQYHGDKTTPCSLSTIQLVLGLVLRKILMNTRLTRIWLEKFLIEMPSYQMIIYIITFNL